MENTLEAATHALWVELTSNGSHYPKWLCSIGQAADRIVVYTRFKEHPKVAESILGWPIEVFHSGGFSIGGTT